MFGIWIGKLTLFALKRLRKGATSFPGKVALRISPRLLKKLGAQLDRCIVVTGTNGKTTTTSLLASMIKQNEVILTNAEGANLAQGLATAFLESTSWFGRLRVRTAVLEIDEATLPSVASFFPVQVLLLTNVFRDQLDRYGELDTTVQKLLEGIQQMESAVIVTNADDPLCRHIGVESGLQTYYYGMTRNMLQDRDREQMRDGAFCLSCGHALQYSGFVYGQLGLYRCPHCDFSRPHPDFAGDFDGLSMTLYESGLKDIRLPLPVRGIFNVYNALAAISAARVVGLDSDKLDAGLRTFQAPTGRMQVFGTTPPVILNLIKNPTGCDSVLQAIIEERGEKVVLIAINDFAADGKDVSWLWDADFDWLAEDDSIVQFVTAGERSEDMSVRLKYAGIESDRIVVKHDLEDAIDSAIGLASSTRTDATVYALSTYTLLHRAAGYLQKKADSAHEISGYRTSVS